MYPWQVRSRVRIGIPWWIGAGSPIEGIQTAGSIGADFVEVSLDAPWPQELSAPKMREAADQAGVDVGFHGPWRTQSLAHPRDVLARGARSVAQDCIDLAIGVDADYVVFHVDARDFGGFPREDVVQGGLEQAHASLRALSRSAGEELSILVENTSSPMGTPAELERFLDPLPDVGFCYDPGHAAMVEQAGIEGASSDPEAWFERLGDRLEVLHLMDYVRTDTRVVDHLVPGAGETDIEGLIAAARAAGCETVLLEAFYNDTTRTEVQPDDLDEAAERVRSLA